MSRSEAREKAFIFLYQTSIQRDDVAEQLKRFEADLNLNSEDTAFFRKIYEGTSAHRYELEERIAPLLHKWTMTRLPVIDRCILLIAAYELLYSTDVPANVAISEAVLLSKQYSSEEARSYINAVLATLLREENDPG